jgi:hypothetical protein
MAEDGLLLDPGFGRDGLVAWVNHDYQTRLSVEDISGDDGASVGETLLKKLLELYRAKDASFPVRAGLEQFMKSGNKGEGGARYDREGLYIWSRHRFPQALDRITEDDFRTLSRDQLALVLEGIALACVAPLPPEAVEDRIAEIFAGTNVAEREDAVELADWCARELSLQIDAEGLTDATEETALQVVLNAYDSRYRPELQSMERGLLLDMIDQHWKQHLYVMDQLRSTIGLRGNSGEDPKAIYKREGMQEFNKMLGVARDRICDMAFGMEEVGGMEDSIWVIDQVRHELAAQRTVNAALQGAVQLRDTTLEGLRTQLASAEAECQSVSQLLARQDEERKRLAEVQTALAEAEARCASSQAEADAARLQLETVQTQRMDFDAALMLKEAQANAWERECRTAKNRADTAVRKSATDAQALKSLKAELAASQTELAAVKGSPTASAAPTADPALAQRMKDLETELAVVSESHARLESELAETKALASRAEDLSEQLGTVEAELAALKLEPPPSPSGDLETLLQDLDTLTR